MTADDLPLHSQAYRNRRFWNWFPMGVTYALLYMGRYNLTVAKNSLGELMTKEDFGLIFGAGTVCYAIAFLINGPLIDRLGGKTGILLAAGGSAVANLVMGLYLNYVMTGGGATEHLVTVFSVLYAVNMYFQSFGAVSIVKVNAHWFHVKERGGFSGIFGTMISSGIFLAFTVNGWLLDLADRLWKGTPSQWVVFIGPAALLTTFGLLEVFLLRDRPSQAGHVDFNTGDASSGEDDKPLSALALYKRILTNPVILTVAFIEFCTGVVRNGVMHWFPIYAKEVWVLPKTHVLMLGAWQNLTVLGVCFVVAAVSATLAARSSGKRRAYLIVFAALLFLSPFVQGGWGGLLFIAGVIGGNVAGWFSDLFFQSRRGPAAGGMYAVLIVLTIGMVFVLAPATNVVEVADPKSGLQKGDAVLEIAGRKVAGWADVTPAVACAQPVCDDSIWDPEVCMCKGKQAAPDAAREPRVAIPARVVRGGHELALEVKDPAPVQRAGDRRMLKDQPVLPLSEYWLGALVFLMSICVIGSHGLLSGTATMDFGGKKGAATAVGIIDGFVYLGTAVQSVSLGYLTSQDWSWWPIFLIPFAIMGFLLSLRIWHAKPSGRSAH